MSTIAAPRMGLGLGSRLSFMMFLQYAIWGAWLPLLWSFLHDYRDFSSGDIGWMFMAGGVGAIFGPFIAGQIADRWFNTEKFLGISHILGGILVWQLAWIESYWVFFGFSIVYSLIYSPTLALTNSLAFHHMPDRDRDFGFVRLWGTVGWIVVGVGIGQWLLHSYSLPEGASPDEQGVNYAKGMVDAFKLSAILGIGMGIYCFTLPSTPPQKGESSFAIGEAVSECSKMPLLLLFLIAVPVSMIHQFYFVYTADFVSGIQTAANSEGANKFASAINQVLGVGGGGLMTIGQMSEILVLGLMPFLTKIFNRKMLLCIGLLAYALRMAIFAYMPGLVPVLFGVALHGLCFGCFIFVAFMVVDEHTTKDVRATAQNLFNLVIVGIGIIVGSYFATGVIGNWAMIDGEIDFVRLFTFPMWMAIGCLVIMLVAYPNRAKPLEA
jgi:nucleoside transporter